MSFLLVLGAIATVLGSLGGLSAFLSYLRNRKVVDRAALVSEFHEISESKSELLDEVRAMRALDKERFSERLAEVEGRLTVAEERLDRCEEEKAQLRDERLLLLEQIKGPGR